MDEALTNASSISDQRQKIEQYKLILSSVLSSNDLLQAQRFIDHSNFSLPNSIRDSTTAFCSLRIRFISQFSGAIMILFRLVLSDDVPLVVSRQLLQSFAQELGRLEPETQKEIAQFTLTQIQPRVVSFEEQVCFLFRVHLQLLYCLVAILYFLKARIM